MKHETIPCHATGKVGDTDTRCSHSLAEEADVWFCSRTEADVKQTHVELLRKYPNARCYGAVVDVSNPKETQEWVYNAVQLSQRIDVVVSNVSAFALTNTAESWSKAFSTDMLGTVTLIEAAQPHLEKSKGNIIAIGSVSGRDVDASAPSPYGAFKAALQHYMAQLAHTLAPKGIRANTVAPGNIYIQDGFWGGVERNQPDLFKDQLAKNPLGRMGRPDEIADLVVFVASERASFVSGAHLVADGALCTGVQL